MNVSTNPHLVVVVHSLGAGGAERVVADLTGWWTEAGRRATVITQSDGSQDVYRLHHNVTRVALGTARDSRGLISALIGNIRRIRLLRRAIRQAHPTVVLGIMPTASILAILASWRLCVPVVASEHTHPPAQPLPALWWRLRRLVYPHAAKVVALTDGTAQWLRNNVTGADVTVIPNPVNWPIPDSGPALPPPPRHQRLQLLAVGRLHRIKGFDRLVEAFALLAGRFPSWDLTILGEGPERSRLEAQVQAVGLSERVFLPGRAGNIGAWYQTTDLYVLSSRAEGLSNTLLEAMATGLPVVAVDCDTGPREIITHGVDGVLARPADDPQALARELAALMGDADARRRLGQQALAVRQRYAPDRIMHLWDKLLT